MHGSRKRAYFSTTVPWRWESDGVHDHFGRRALAGHCLGFVSVSPYPKPNQWSRIIDVTFHFNGEIFGVISRMRRARPSASIHLSTQANAINWMAVQFYQDLGISRVVVPRELSLKEIVQIREKVPSMELEVFVHGSMCMAYSGRCLISNYLTHRDSNQGNCANSCRWQYKLSSDHGSLRVVENQFEPFSSHIDGSATYHVRETHRSQERFEIDEDESGSYLFNSKDLCAIELLSDLRDAGVASIKVEGRTKSLYYVAIVARAYRAGLADLNDGSKFDPANLHELIGTSNRSLMTGFLVRRPLEYGQNYDDGGSLPLTHIFVGNVINDLTQRDLVQVEIKNRIAIGDEIEWISPTSSRLSRVTELWRGDTLVSSVSGGTKCRIAVPFTPEPYTILRKRIEEHFEVASQTA